MAQNWQWYHPRNHKDIIPKPWLAEAAIEYFESLLNKDMKVIEHGGGGSTLWLAERVAEVMTVEQNAAWYEAIRAKAPINVCMCGAFVTDTPDYDLLFIDGEPVEDRGWWLDHAREYVRAGGHIVLDNANRPEYAGARAKFQAEAELLKMFQSAGGKYFMTEFYRLK